MPQFITNVFDAQRWAAVPFHVWTVAAFVYGSMVGSFLNVCIYRMPLGLSIVSPPSHCPHCKYSIPWYRNIPLLTWLSLKGRCANCQAPISIRYFLVELLTGVVFTITWLCFGRHSVGLALVFALILAAFIVATFIDIEHLIIPDAITLGGIPAGLVCSALVPALHHARTPADALLASALGAAVGGGLMYGVLRGGKMLFGRRQIVLPPNSRIIFTESALVLPEETIPYEDIFYRRTDAVEFHARTLELVDRCYRDVPVHLTQTTLTIGGDTFNPETIKQLEAVTDELALPREAMGLGDVKFMAAIGAFLGWPAVLFSLFASSLIGAVVGIVLVALKKQEWSGRLPYGPYIVLGAVLWIFGGGDLVRAWWRL